MRVVETHRTPNGLTHVELIEPDGHGFAYFADDDPGPRLVPGSYVWVVKGEFARMADGIHLMWVGRKAPLEI